MMMSWRKLNSIFISIVILYPYRKMKKTYFFSVAWLWFLLNVTVVQAQTAPDSTVLYRIETTDGNEYLGTIVNEDTEKIHLKTQQVGTITIAKSTIKSMVPVNLNQVKGGAYWFDNPQSTRYLFAPNGYGLRKGEGYYQNILVFVNQASVGITDNISVGAGVVPFFLFGGPTPIWLVPKVSIPIKKDKINVGVGALIGTVLDTESDSYDESSSTGFGLAYGQATFGSRDRNISLGLGYGYADGGWANYPTLTLSALIRTGRRGYFITENYLITTGYESIGLISLGGRRIIKTIGIDFGLVIPTGLSTDFVAVPFLGLTIPFGQKNRAIAEPRQSK